jgi:hypothetical protein
MAEKEGAMKRKKEGDREEEGLLVFREAGGRDGIMQAYFSNERVPQEMTMRAPAKDIIIVEMAAPSPTRPP